MSYTRVMESRPYDTHYDPVYTGPYNNPASDPRVAAAASSSNAVAGNERPKYFKRPIMPRINAVPPHLLLAPTGKEDPMVIVDEEPVPTVKNAEVQTMYRESEAQTVPYTPNYFVREGEEPEILMLQGLTYGNGLPIGQKELEMIENARAKKELESSLPPFTDEACLGLRKKLMEYSELKEYNLREKEIDSQREGRLLNLRRALDERDENNEFLASQRIEALRQNRMDEREKMVQQIRKKRVKILRRLARNRNEAEPSLSSTVTKDIIDEYYNHGSKTYAPLKREGRDAQPDTTKYDINTRAPPLHTVGAIMSLETTIPKTMLEGTSQNPLRNFSPVREMSKTAPAVVPGGGRVAKDRLTSSTLRKMRNTKRDVETMHTILSKKKQARSQGVIGTSSLDALNVDDINAQTMKSTFKARNLQTQGRPTTPDFSLLDERTPDDDSHTHIACLLLQKLIRGRAVQNSMYEGRVRRAELIAELRAADEAQDLVGSDDVQENAAKRVENFRVTTVDVVAGNIVSNSLSLLASEQDRIDTFTMMNEKAKYALVDRYEREAQEAGRRQREGLDVPNPDAGDDELSGFGDGLSVDVSLDGDDEYEDGGRGSASVPMKTPIELVELLRTAVAEQKPVETLLEDLDSYPTLVDHFRKASSSEEQEQVSRDLVLALHSRGAMAEKYAAMDVEDKEALVLEVLERLRDYVGSS